MNLVLKTSLKNVFGKPLRTFLVVFSIFICSICAMLCFDLVSSMKETLGGSSLELITSQTKFFESTAKADKEIRAMKHDMRNNIQVLMLLQEKGEYDKMREYLEEMGENLVSTDVRANTGDMIADAIISDKIAEAKSKNIKLKNLGKIDGVKITPVDMCKMLANLLDNAIEAASAHELSDMEDSLRVIELQFKKTDNFFMISVTNPCLMAPQTKDGKIATSKFDSKNHGFEIHNIESAAANYGGEYNVSFEEKAFGFLCRSEIFIPIAE